MGAVCNHQHTFTGEETERNVEMGREGSMAEFDSKHVLLDLRTAAAASNS